MSIPHNVALPVSSDSDDSLELEDESEDENDNPEKNSDDPMDSEDDAKSNKSGKSLKSARSSILRISGRDTPVSELNNDPKYQSANVIFVSSDSSVSSSDSAKFKKK